jgi:catechol 2,3-dioxygenase-like lactoylglutathione lyase family enzyme
MRGATLFAAGLFAGLAVHVGMAQNAKGGVVMMNHVGINVPNIAEAVTYYTQKMGYREAFRVHDDKGQPRLGLPAHQQEHVSRAGASNRSAARRFHALRAPCRECGRGGREVQKERRDGE